MNKTVIVWTLSFLITAASAWYQRVTGPTYPLGGSAALGNTSIRYRLERSHAGDTDAPVGIIVPDSSVSGTLEWKRYKTDDAWTSVAMKRKGDDLSAGLPLQPPAGKLLYRVILRRGSDTLSVPREGGAVIRFKGDVPTGILAVHIFLMFTGMLFSTRAGLSAFSGEENLGRFSAMTIGLLTAGGLVLGPVVQKYAFGAYWTGWPFGTDLTDNKTVAALAAWIVFTLMQKRMRRPGNWALAAALVTLAVFMVPHSLFGSELDYRGGKGGAPVSVSVFAPVHAYECAPDGGRHRRLRAADGAPHDLAQLQIGDRILPAEIHLLAPLLTEPSPRVFLFDVDRCPAVHEG